MNKRLKSINYSKRFLKQLKKAPIGIKIAFKERFRLFLQNPFHPQLNNHQLTGKLKKYRSLNITGDWRAIYSEIKDSAGDTVVIFEMLGTTTSFINDFSVADLPSSASPNRGEQTGIVSQDKNLRYSIFYDISNPENFY